MNVKKKWLIVLLLVCFVMGGYAQRGLEIHGGLAVPLGDLADENNGSAGTGFCGGAKYFYALRHEGISLVGGIDLFLNDVSSSLKDEYPDYEFSSYVNLPIYAGVNYQYPLSGNTSVLLEADLGLNTSVASEISGYYTCDPSSALCFNLGIGLLIKRFELQLTYNHLGSHSYLVTYDSDNYTENWDMNVSEITFTLGFRLFSSQNASTSQSVKKPNRNIGRHSKHGGK